MLSWVHCFLVLQKLIIMLVRFCFVLWELFTKFSSPQHQETTIILKLLQSKELMSIRIIVR